jgi:hypothetical protein
MGKPYAVGEYAWLGHMKTYHMRGGRQAIDGAPDSCQARPVRWFFNNQASVGA